MVLAPDSALAAPVATVYAACPDSQYALWQPYAYSWCLVASQSLSQSFFWQGKIMNRNFSALAAGILFGLGLVISQMTNPEKVIGFLDLFGQWDPSLAFVMGGALIVTTIGYPLVTRQARPKFDSAFQIPANKQIDRNLVLGSVMFGAGWGLVGLCPGPAIAALTIGGLPVVIFFIAMGAGMALYEIINTQLPPAIDPTPDSNPT